MDCFLYERDLRLNRVNEKKTKEKKKKSKIQINQSENESIFYAIPAYRIFILLGQDYIKIYSCKIHQWSTVLGWISLNFAYVKFYCCK